MFKTTLVISSEEEVDQSFVATDEEDKHLSFPCLPSLSKLNIEDFPKLTSMPLYPHLDDLTLESSLKPLY